MEKRDTHDRVCYEQQRRMSLTGVVSAIPQGLCAVDYVRIEQERAQLLCELPCKVLLVPAQQEAEVKVPRMEHLSIAILCHHGGACTLELVGDVVKDQGSNVHVDGSSDSSGVG